MTPNTRRPTGMQRRSAMRSSARSTGVVVTGAELGDTRA